MATELRALAEERDALNDSVHQLREDCFEAQDQLATQTSELDNLRQQAVERSIAEGSSQKGRIWRSCVGMWFSGLHPPFVVVQSVAVLHFDHCARRRECSCFLCSLQATVLDRISWYSHDPARHICVWIEVRMMVCDMSGDAAAKRSAVSRLHMMPCAMIWSLTA